MHCPSFAKVLLSPIAEQCQPAGTGLRLNVARSRPLRHLQSPDLSGRRRSLAPRVYTDAVASISMSSPGRASPVTPAMVWAGCCAPPVTSSMPLVIVSYSVGVVV